MPVDGSTVCDDWMKDLILVAVKKDYGLECLDFNQRQWEEICSPISSHDKTG
jgi:hypothetical protein